MFELLWLSNVLHVLEAHALNLSWTDALTAMPMKRGKKSKKQLKKEQHNKRHRKMQRRAVRHMRHMQKVHEAIRMHRRTQKLAIAAGGMTTMKPGEDMNADIASMVGAAKQKLQQRMHEATKPKTLEAQQQINALRQRTHASRVQAQRRAASVFGHAR